MKKLIINTILFLLLAVNANAQCVAEVKDVVIDDVRGSIVVKTEYKLNGQVVNVHAIPEAGAIGQTRYTEQSGTIQEIVAQAKADIEEHCGNLIIRNAVRVNDLKAQQLAIQKALTEPLVADLKTNAVGWTKTLTEKVFTYKNKEITVNANGTYSVADIVE